MAERVTVVMPVYNAERYLCKAIESILGQTHRDIEFIIIDDGSTDSSAEIISHYKDSRIRFLQNEENLMICRTLNRGIEAATGQYLARMDADDVAYPNRLAVQLDFLRSHPTIAGVGARMRTTRGTVWKNPSDPQELHAAMYFANSLFHPTLFIRTSVFHDMTLRYDDQYLYAEEWDLWFRILRNHQLANIPYVLMDYRFHAASSGELYRPQRFEFCSRVLHREWSLLGLSDSQIDQIVRHSALGEPVSRLDELESHGEFLVTTAYRALLSNEKIGQKAVSRVINRQLYCLFTYSRVPTPLATKAYISVLSATEGTAKAVLAKGFSRFLLRRLALSFSS
jgi:glycosyltransferase involved in cell wall biosynthesis